jgi:hypothetical protein
MDPNTSFRAVPANHPSLPCRFRSALASCDQLNAQNCGSVTPLDGALMANISAAAPTASGEFRIGQVLSRSFTLLSRNFLMFFVTTLVATLPLLPLQGKTRASHIVAGSFRWTSPEGVPGWLSVLLFFAWLVLYITAQVVVLYGAFQAMRGRPVNLSDGLRLGLARFFSILGVGLFVVLAFVALIILTFLIAWSVPSVTTFIIITLVLLALSGVLWTMWFVSIPACVVEQLGPLASMGRSAALTRGCRWKIFGMVLVVLIVGMLAGIVITAVIVVTGSSVLITLVNLAWNALVTAFYAVFVAVTYHDLRAAKEGVDIHEIAAVFD